MLSLKAGDFISSIKGTLEKGNPEFVVRGISTDTRTIKEGDLYIPLSGENFDGHNFIEKALAAGASGFITSKKDYINLPADLIISVSDPLEAYEKLAGFNRRKFKLPVVAITGSNGKTTTKELIFALLSQKYNSILKSKENFNNEIGVSRTLLDMSSEYDCAVLEFAMRGRGEIALLADIALPTAGVITNIGEAHIGRLGSRREIANAKGELIERLPSEGLAVLNRDNDWFDYIKNKVSSSNLLTFGLSSEADIYCSQIKEMGLEGTEMNLHFKGKKEKIFFPMIGLHNIYNLLASVCVCVHLIEEPSFSDILRTFVPPSSGRTRIIRNKDNIVIIDDTYNSNPLAVKSSLHMMAGYFPESRKIAVLGDMLELGNEEIHAHTGVGQWVSEYNISHLFTYGPLSKFTAEEALKKGVDASSFDDKNKIIKKLEELLQAGDVVLVKGSRGMRMEEVVGYFL